MDGAHCRGSFWLACLLVLAVVGCANSGKGRSWNPFAKKAPKPLPPGVVLPTERIAQLRKLVKEAPRADAAKKQQVAAELVRSFQTEQDPMIRAELIRTMGAYPGPDTDAILRAALGDADAEVRLIACEVWGKRGDAEAVRLLSGILGGDVDKDVRLAAARMLGRCRDPAAVAALGDALEDKDPAMQYRAVVSLREVTNKDFGNDVAAWRQFVKGETPQPKPVSIAERLHRIFY